jgi:hypothetical protein
MKFVSIATLHPLLKIFWGLLSSDVLLKTAKEENTD